MSVTARPSTLLALPARCDRAAADVLLPRLRAAVAAGDVAIDGGDVVQFGQAMLQLLLSARAAAAATGHRLTIAPSPSMRGIVAMAGAAALLGTGDAA